MNNTGDLVPIIEVVAALGCSQSTVVSVYKMSPNEGTVVTLDDANTYLLHPHKYGGISLSVHDL